MYNEEKIKEVKKVIQNLNNVLYMIEYIVLSHDERKAINAWNIDDTPRERRRTAYIDALGYSDATKYIGQCFDNREKMFAEYKSDQDVELLILKAFKIVGMKDIVPTPALIDAAAQAINSITEKQAS